MSAWSALQISQRDKFRRNPRIRNLSGKNLELYRSMTSYSYAQGNIDTNFWPKMSKLQISLKLRLLGLLIMLITNIVSASLGRALLWSYGKCMIGSQSHGFAWKLVYCGYLIPVLHLSFGEARTGALEG
ncbi:unnamed protein product [Strongylus vulgaris]|uniref:Uncharacterized protein n=1 Tax=Strongylus vulgaris TaxID=40348 RepID=A0A3P7JUI2_STRVU|nr:unnamed protein product [Strongylus vulgaris]